MLKPQDPVILMWIAASGARFTFAELAQALKMSTSVVFESLKRCDEARLYDFRKRELRLERFRHCFLHAIEYVSPAEPGEMTRGVPTGPSALASWSGECIVDYVWPSPQGAGRGRAVKPLVPSVVALSLRDSRFHRLAALADALRLDGAAHRSRVEKELDRLLQDSEEAAAKRPSGPSVFASSEAPGTSANSETRRQIVQAAERLFLRDGFRQTSFEDVCRSARVEEAEARRFFAAKTELEDEVLRRQLEKLGPVFGSGWVLGPLANLETLSGILQRFTALVERDPDLHRAAQWMSLSDEIFGRVSRESRGAFIEQMANLVGSITRSPARHDSTIRALLFLCLLRAYSEFRWAYLEPLFPRDLQEAFLRQAAGILRQDLLPALVRGPAVEKGRGENTRKDPHSQSRSPFANTE